MMMLTMGKPGKTLKLIKYVLITFIVSILFVGTLLLVCKHGFFFTYLITPLTIMLSASLGVLSAVMAASSNRRETLRQNTLKMLNHLDSDTDYWTEADKLTQAIAYGRSKFRANGKCHQQAKVCDTELLQCECCFKQDEINQLFAEYLSTDLSSKLAEKIRNGKCDTSVDVNLVIRKMEWLCEQASLGLIDEGILGKRKGVMINFVYCACKQIIEAKQKNHADKYGVLGKETSHLVYRFISDKQLRCQLLKYAIKA
jgi:hypothetical protein